MASCAGEADVAACRAGRDRTWLARGTGGARHAVKPLDKSARRCGDRLRDGE